MSAVRNFLTQSKFIPVNIEMGAALGMRTAALLSAHISCWDIYHKKGDGEYYQTRNQLVKHTGISATAQQRYEKTLLNAGFITRRRKGITKKNFYEICEDNLTAFMDNPKKYIKKVLPNYIVKDWCEVPIEDDSKGAIQSVVATDSTSRPDRTNNKYNNNDFSLTSLKHSHLGEQAPLSDSQLDPSVDKENKSNTTRRRTLPPPKVNRKVINIKQGNPSDRKKVSKRKVHKDTLELIEYWNSLPGLQNTKLNLDNNGMCRLVEQTKKVQKINDIVLKITKGTLYARRDDIKHKAYKNMAFSIDRIKEAMSRISMTTSENYKGDSKRKHDLAQFFICEYAEVYTENKKGMYRYRYPFIHFMMNSVEKAEVPRKEVQSEYSGIAATVATRFTERGMRLTKSDRREIQKTVDMAMELIVKKRSLLINNDITKMMMNLPHLFEICLHQFGQGQGIRKLWYVINYKFEGYLVDKRYMKAA